MTSVLSDGGPRRSRFKGADQPSNKRIIFSLFCLIAAVIALGGGSSKPLAFTLIFIRPMLGLLAAVLIFMPVQRKLSSINAFWLLLAFAILHVVQLVPLPPSIWSALPGHSRFHVAMQIPGWRPLSVVPILTMNSLFSLLPAFAVILAMSRLHPDYMRWPSRLVLIIAACSILLSVIQVASGMDGFGYYYPQPSVGSPTGFLANRNHQAAFLAASLPLLSAWSLQHGRYLRAPIARQTITIILTILFMITILMTGSRTGLILSIISLVLVIILQKKAINYLLKSRLGRTIVAIAILFSLVFMYFILQRESSISRLGQIDSASPDLRFQALPVIIKSIGDFFPWGSGFGTFDPVFRMREPDSMLFPTYFNNAHNDLLELIMASGLFGLVLLCAFLVLMVWMLVMMLRALPSKSMENSKTLRSGFAWIAFVLIMLLASLTDYPLRTPLLGGLTVLAIVMAEICAASLKVARLEGRLSVGRSTAKRDTETGV